MILFISKKVTAIYRANSILFVLIFLCVHSAFAEADLHTFCFERNVSLAAVKNSLAVLLLPKDIVTTREENNCIDIVASPDRGKLFEKFLSKRYDVIQDVERSFERKSQSCRFEFKTTRKRKVDTTELAAGPQTKAVKKETDEASSTTMDLLLGIGTSGELEMSPKRLKIICQNLRDDFAMVTFSFLETEKANIETQVQLRKGEWLNIGSVQQDLNSKSKTLGIPETNWSDTNGKVETVYELLLK